MDMKASMINLEELLEQLALQAAAETMQAGMNHGSKICKLPVKSWQADKLRAADDVPNALDPADFRKMMKNPDVPVIFLPREAVVTREVIDRICRESALNKIIVWETA